MGAEYQSLPFDAAIKFFKGKVRVPTEHYRDLEGAMHTRAFTVAGGIRDELLADFQAAVLKAIAKGTTLEDFRDDFDAIVEKHGWTHTGKPGWRSRVIYQTNIRTAYSAGRYQQLKDPDLLSVRPYWQYHHGDSVNPRPQHLAWDGLVLRHDDPWWEAHYPPNDWGCSCSVTAKGDRDLRKLGKEAPDTAPDDGTYTRRDPRTGGNVRLPKGVGLGWDYNVGEAAWGRPLAKALIDLQAGGKWSVFGDTTPRHRSRIETAVPADKTKTKPAKRTRSESDLRDTLRAAIGGAQAAIEDPRGEVVQVNQALVDHMLEDKSRLDGRERYFPFIRETIENPFEIWVSFARNELTGKVGIRRRYIKRINLPLRQSLVLVGEVSQGFWTGLTFFQRDPNKPLDTFRRGHLVWSREE